MARLMVLHLRKLNINTQNRLNSFHFQKIIIIINNKNSTQQTINTITPPNSNHIKTIIALRHEMSKIPKKYNIKIQIQL